MDEIAGGWEGGGGGGGGGKRSSVYSGGAGGIFVFNDTTGDHGANPLSHHVCVCLNEQVLGSDVKSLGCRIHDIQFVLKVSVLRVSVSASVSV